MFTNRVAGATASGFESRLPKDTELRGLGATAAKHLATRAQGNAATLQVLRYLFHIRRDAGAPFRRASCFCYAREALRPVALCILW
eukprot:4166722-Pyramimonas_sp.AAC.1